MTRAMGAPTGIILSSRTRPKGKQEGGFMDEKIKAYVGRVHVATDAELQALAGANAALIETLRLQAEGVALVQNIVLAEVALREKQHGCN